MRKSLYFLLLATALFLCIPFSFASKPAIEKIDIADGLSDNNVLSIAQDKHGFVWIGTEWGLNRFDGKNISVFKYDRLNDNTISQNGVNKVLYDEKRDIVWFGTKGGGINFYDYSTGKFGNYISKTPIKGPLSISITDICFSNDDNIWISTYQDGIQKLFVEGDSIIDFSGLMLPQLSGYKIKSIAEDEKGNLFIGHWGEGLTVFNPETGHIRYFKNDKSDPSSLPGNEIMDIFIDSAKRVWLSTHYGIAIYNYDTEDFTVYRHSPDNVNSLSVDDIHKINEIDGKLWIGTWRGGINILDLKDFDPKNNKTQKFEYLPYLEDGTTLTCPSVVDIFKDSFGNIWMATYGGGVNLISHLPPYFNTISIEKSKKHGFRLSTNIVTSLNIDKNGNLWAGMVNSMMDVFGKDGSRKSFRKENAIPKSNTINILTDRDGDAWIGVDRVGLMKYDNKSDKFLTVRDEEDMKRHDYVTAIYEDNNRNIWIGSNYGIGYYDKHSGKYTEVDLKIYGIKDAFVKSIVEDINGNLWIGTNNNGVLILSDKYELMHNFLIGTGFPANMVNHIHKADNGSMWVGTYSGFVYFDRITDNDYRFTVLGRQNELADECVKAISSSDNNEIWLSTNTGISKYIVDEKRFINYNIDNGINCGSFNPGVVARSDDGIIYFGSQSGICYFDSKISDHNRVIPDANIVAVSLYDKSGYKSVIKENLPLKKRYEFDHFDNTFRIDFNVMDFALKNETEYIYTLKGYEDVWHEADQNNVIFQNLPYGRYIFSVKSKLNNQIWGSEETSIEILIHPPLWLRWWAKVIYALLAVIAMAVAVFIYKRRLDLKNTLYLEKQQYIQAQQLNEERINFFTNITHELRTPLTLILGPLEEIEKGGSDLNSQRGKISLIRNNAIKLHQLISRILEFRKCETMNKTLSVRSRNLPAHISAIVSKFSGANTNKNIIIKEDIDMDIAPIWFDAEVITTIVDNLLSNAVKYTNSGEVNVSLRKSEDSKEITIKVSDTGIGIPENCIEHIFESYYQAKNNNGSNGTGIGLALVKSLTDLHKGKIDVQSRINEGTIFTLIISAENIYSAEEIYSEQIVKPVVSADRVDSDDRFISVDRFDAADHVDSDDSVDPVGSVVSDVSVNSFDPVDSDDTVVSNDYVNPLDPVVSVVSDDDYSLDRDLINDEILTERKVRENDFDIILADKDQSKPMMLIVEDNRELREFIAGTFCNEYKILSAENGEEGLKTALEKLPDIIISDVMMPVMDGIEMCRRIKEEISTCHIPVIMLTAKDSINSKNEGYDNGADSYITKPFSITLLKTRVENLLAGRKKIMTYFKSGEFKKNAINTSINKKDADFITSVNDFISDNIGTEELSISFLAEKFNMSYSSFSRKVKAVTGLTVNDIIKKIRMKRAEELLISGKNNVSEIAEIVGYNSVAAFREAFKGEYGESPSSYVNNIKKGVGQ